MKFNVYTLIIAIVLLSSCGMSAQHSNMHDGAMSMPTPNTQATPVAYLRNIALIDPWARPGSKGDNSASYVVINNGGTADTLIGVRSDVAASVELHTVENSNGMMQMKQVEGGIAVAENSIQALQPGGFHIMMIGLTRDLVAGDTFDITLTFATAGDVTITFTVR